MKIEFDVVLECIKGLENVEIIGDESEGSDFLFFKKNNTRFLLGRPEREDDKIRDDFSLSIIIRPDALAEEKLSYIEILEVVNTLNQLNTTPCRLSYRKKINSFIIEITHIMFAQNSASHDIYIANNLKHYLPMAVLSMMMLLLETFGMLENEIADKIKNNKAATDEKNQ